MMIYRTESRSNAKWLVAAIIFIIAMTFTFDQAFGAPTPPSGSQDTRHNHRRGTDNQSHHHSNNNYTPQNEGVSGGNTPPAPSAVPEPTTIILLGMGLAAAGAVRRKMK